MMHQHTEARSYLP